MCSDAPDTSGMNAAAVANAQLSKESLDFYKQVYAEGAGDRAQASATAKQVADAQLSSMKQNDAISKDYYDYSKSTFRPLETGLVADAQNYDTQERRDAKAAGAVADVGMQAQVARDSQNRSLQRAGVNPSSGKALALDNQMALGEATAKAGAANTARTNVELQGYARKMDSANLGRGLASSQATSAGVALNAGNSAVTNAGMPLTQAQGQAAMMGQGFNTAINANSSAGSIYGQQAQIENQANSNNNAWMSAAGTAAGGWAAGGFKTSDIHKKKNIKAVSDETALKAIEDTPVSEWDYKNGAGDGGHHTGPMAQDVQKNMGEAAGPDGKQIDLITMNGITMAGIAALSRKVDRIAKNQKQGEKS